MRKQEYIHIHALLAEVSNDVQQRGTDVDLADYDALGVKPTSIHKSKTDHKEAVQALASAITENMDESSEKSERRVAATAD